MVTLNVGGVLMSGVTGRIELSTPSMSDVEVMFTDEDAFVVS
jgi:hypothetical protein